MDSCDTEAVTLDGEPIEDEYLVLSDNPQVDDGLILRMIHDLAMKVHASEVIARRYGLKGVTELREFLKQHPQIVWEVRKLRAAFQSDEATETRLRLKFLRATEQLIIPMAGLAGDHRTPINARIDAFKLLQRGAGVDGMPAQARDNSKPQGHAFNLTINFAGGRDATRISGTTVVDADQIPPPRSPMGLTVDEVEDAGFEEEVDV